MHTIEFDKHIKIRVSFDTLEELEIKKHAIIQRDIPANAAPLPEDRCFTIEIMLPLNASYYVLLGARYSTMDEQEGHHLEVAYTKEKMDNYENALSYTNTTVFKGISTEYAQTVLDTATAYLQVHKAPRGKIIVDRAAYCEVGSSPLMFTIATKIVLAILLGCTYPISDAQIIEIVKQYLQERKKSI